MIDAGDILVCLKIKAWSRNDLSELLLWTRSLTTSPPYQSVLLNIEGVVDHSGGYDFC